MRTMKKIMQCAFAVVLASPLVAASETQETKGTRRVTSNGKEHTFFIFLHPNNPKLGSQGLKNVCGKFSMERD